MLTDFGIARLLRSSPNSTAVGGTPAYMAPEAFDGKRNERTDIWAVGVGELPYPQQDYASFIGAIMRFDPPSLSDSLPETVRQIVMKALNRDPTYRYASVGEMRNDLRDAEQLRWLSERRARETLTVRDIRTEDVSPAFRDQETLALANTVCDLAPMVVDTSKEQRSEQKAGDATGAEPAPARKADSSVRENMSKAHDALAPPVQQQSRFSILIVLGIIGFVGLVLWLSISYGPKGQSRRDNSANTTGQGQTSVSPVTPSPTRSPVPPPSAGITVTNEIGMHFVGIPDGEFTMGSDRRNDQRPPHPVAISRPFYLGEYEVTQKQWQAVMGTNPSHFKGEELPVEEVSWDDTQEFIKKLNELDADFTYRLPTEAEWEYACRAGTKSVFAFGNSLSSAQANIGDPRTSIRNANGTFQGKTMRVGSFRPNAFGLYDMHGNVMEWCQSFYEYGYSIKGATGATIDPQGPAFDSRRSQYHVSRGGAWNYDASQAESAYRSSEIFTRLIRTNLGETGFRLVAVPR